MRKKILTAGPSITKKEIKYVLDAVKNGWNENWDGYLKKFERLFAEFIGSRYALATSSCTGAMHLALLALGIKTGDEVIVPDLCWAAAANAIKYVGAVPVLVDVLEDTWCIDPVCVKKAITAKTKAIMPVHLYGHPCDMNSINRLAEDKGLFVIEDAAQAIGSSYQEMGIGKLGDIGCFSFQGAKIMVTGEGGMLVTDNLNWYKRAKFYNNHGRDPNGSLRILEVGYKYKMSNLQAALGLAQLERINEFIKKKRLIYKWYHERLWDLDGVALNVQKPDAVNNYWMSSIVLAKKFSVSRNELIKILKDRFHIETRPFFYPLSALKPFEKRFKNKVSYYLANKGLNLPSGHNLKERDVDYIAKSIKEILLING